MGREQDLCLMAHKPTSITDIKSQIDRMLQLEDIDKLVGENDIVMAQFHNWEDLMMTHLGAKQWWLVSLIEEDLSVVIDTQGYSYPRHVGILNN